MKVVLKLTHLKKSLNECLHRGPNMVANKVAVLLRIKRLTAFIADIKKAYLQLELHTGGHDLPVSS